MPAAEPCALRDGSRFDVLSIRIQNQMCAGAAYLCSIRKREFFQLLRVLFNADVSGICVYDLAGAFIQSLDPGFFDTFGNQIGKGNGISAGKQDTGIAGKAAGCAENQTVGVFQQLPIHHDDVVT